MSSGGFFLFCFVFGFFCSFFTVAVMAQCMQLIIIIIINKVPFICCVIGCLIDQIKNACPLFRVSSIVKGAYCIHIHIHTRTR